ncbi:gamma-glutamyltranspeptidase [Planosporangium thailandense]|uniref:Gamma-glutamyltranspeptidase n=1 Tax=Planosporangium thailandense TaxID=765197 RepID=A0ABX0XVM5_9ACTN|nr:gamma-glutamyltransferase [Planosporangium thailandense]NJC70082.1 gamma-glutamyltranspeptidase [Planosporangium thailandense]
MEAKPVPAGVAAGHPATAEVGLRVLHAGGSAADAAVAAVLAGCVAESVLTGITGGGFATYYDAASGSVTCLDFFCAVPGLDGDVTPGPMAPIEVVFGGVPMSYEIGESSVAVPGLPAGVGEVHRRWGRLPWHRVVTPAVSLARSGVVLPAAQARTLISIAPAMVPGVGATIYSPGGKLLEGGDLLFHPGLDVALDALATEGPAVFYTGWIGDQLVKTVRAGGGTIGPADLAGYRVLELPVERAPLAGAGVYARRDLNNTIPTIAALPADLPGLSAGERAVALAGALLNHGAQRVGDTTNISVVDFEGNACVITMTLGLGSGVWLPGLGVHLNSMLGEGELITGEPVPGQRMSSMMCPLVVIDDDGELLIAAGSAGASRIRTALLHTLVNVLVKGADMTAAISQPRFHVVADLAGGAPVAHVEPGYPADEVAALVAAGYEVRWWDRVDHYFGGASAVGHAGAAGDPRRGGVGRLA